MAASHAYRPDIDGLRAVAVIAVAAFHGFPSAVPGGFIGVDVFFVISGYLITGILLGQSGSTAEKLGVFYARRIRRIFPALILVVAAAIAFASVMLFSEELRRLGKLAVATAVFVPNLALWYEGGYFDTNVNTKPLLHLWSLGIEEQFYLAWPCLLFLGRGGRRLAALTVFLATASFLTGMLQVHRDLSAAFYWPLGRAWELLAGAGLAQWALFRPEQIMAWGWPREILGWGGLAFIAAGLFGMDGSLAFPGAWAAIPVLGTAGLIAAGPQAFCNRALLSNRAMQSLGLISYPLYLWHWPLLSYARILAGGDPSAAVRGACLAAALPLAAATYLWVEKPIRTGRKHPGTVRALVLAMSLLGAMGALLYFSGGLPHRRLNLPFESPASRLYGHAGLFDRACAEDLHSQPMRSEICLTSSKRPEYLFIGDSHAMSVYSAIESGAYRLPAALVAGRSCKLYPGLENSPEFRYGYEAKCTGIEQDAIRVAAANASITTVILAAVGPDMGAPSPFLLAGRRLKHGEALLLGQGKMIDTLQRLGKRVIFLIDTPTFPYQPGECEARYPFPAPRDCRVPQGKLLSTRTEYVRAVDTLAQRYPSLLVVDAATSVCDGEYCDMKANGRWLYHDWEHLNPLGAMAVLRLFEKAGYIPTTLDNR